MTPREAAARRSALAEASGGRVMLLSGVTGQGVPEVLRALQQTIPSPAERTRAREAEVPHEPLRSQPSPGTQGREILA